MSILRGKTAGFIFSVLLFFWAGCASSARGADSVPRGTVRFTCNIPDAALEIDETRVGPAGMFKESGVLLKSGTHRIVVYKEGFFKEYRLITVETGKLLVVDIDLKAVPY